MDVIFTNWTALAEHFVWLVCVITIGSTIMTGLFDNYF